MEDIEKVFYRRNKKSKKKYKNKIQYGKNVNHISHEKKDSSNQFPQIINNYDIKLNIIKEKSNNININSMNINSLYSQTDSLNNYYNLDNKSNIFKNIRLNNFLNKTDNHVNTKYSPIKTTFNSGEFDIKYGNKKKKNYDEMISTLKNEFKVIEYSHKSDYLSKTQNLNNDINFNNNDILNELDIKLLKINDNIKINKINRKTKNNLDDIFLTTDVELLKDKKNKKIKINNNSIEKKVSKNKNKNSLDLTNYNLEKKENSNIYRINNFNEIYDNLINPKTENPTNKAKSHSSDKRNNLKTICRNLRNNKSSNTSINSRSFKKSIKYNELNNNIDNNKKKRNYYKCNLFDNLNKLSFKRNMSNKKYIKNNKYKICNNISFSYHISKFDKFNNYFKDKKYVKKKLDTNNTKNLLILNEIINIQNNMIIQYRKNEEKLKKELILKNIEIDEYKKICYKFIYHLEYDKIKTLDNNKKSITIQSQLLKENEILKQIFLSNKVSLFKNDKSDESIFNAFFEHEKKFHVENEHSKLINKNKRNHSNERKNQNKKGNNKDNNILNAPINLIRNNNYDFLLKLYPYLDNKSQKNSELEKYDIHKYKKKLCYLHKNKS